MHTVQQEHVVLSCTPCNKRHKLWNHIQTLSVHNDNFAVKPISKSNEDSFHSFNYLTYMLLIHIHNHSNLEIRRRFEKSNGAMQHQNNQLIVIQRSSTYKTISFISIACNSFIIVLIFNFNKQEHVQLPFVCETTSDVYPQHRKCCHKYVHIERMIFVHVRSSPEKVVNIY